ncbi:hypothetical protein WG66_015919 [Moniliophthora roreri]|nr:hypothetical protein WG66_015919 [Moniliophthora roreri]
MVTHITPRTDKKTRFREKDPPELHPFLYKPHHVVPKPKRPRHSYPSNEDARFLAATILPPYNRRLFHEVFRLTQGIGVSEWRFCY